MGETENKIKSFEIYSTNFSQIIQAVDIQTAIAEFLKLNPNEEVIFAENIFYRNINEKPQKKWISIKERLPDFGMAILMYLDNGVIGCGYRSEDEKDDNIWHLYHDDLVMEDSKVTHWMPLPKEPN